jgi:hypothetical protein
VVEKTLSKDSMLLGLQYEFAEQGSNPVVSTSKTIMSGFFSTTFGDGCIFAYEREYIFAGATEEESIKGNKRCNSDKLDFIVDCMYLDKKV